MKQYKKGETVSVFAKVGGRMTHVTGEVFFVIQVDSELQCLTIYGSDPAGKAVRTKTYNDDRSLEPISSRETISI